MMAIAFILVAFGCIVGMAATTIILAQAGLARNWLGVACASILLVGCVVGLAQSAAGIRSAFAQSMKGNAP